MPLPEFIRRKLYGRTLSEQRTNAEDEAWAVPRGKGASAKDGKDGIAREQFAAKRLNDLGFEKIQVVETHTGGRIPFNPLGRDEQYDRIAPGWKYDAGRREFLRKAAIFGGAAAAIAVGSGAMGNMIGRSQATPGSGINGPTLTSGGDFDAKRIGGVRYATEFDSASHAGTSVDPFLGGAISSAISDTDSVIGGLVFMPGVYYNLGTTAVSMGIGGDLSGRKVLLIGAGRSTRILWSGTGYGIAITGTASVNEYARLADFTIDGNAVTTGRHGVQIGSQAILVDLYNLEGRNLDTVFDVNDTNQVTIDRLVANTGNTGILTGAGGNSSPNAIRIYRLNATSCSVRAIDLEGGARCVIEDSVFELNAVGIYIAGTGDSYSLVRNYHEGATSRDILIAGAPTNVVVDGERSNSTCAYFMEIDSALRCSLRNIHTSGHATAVLDIPVTNSIGLYIENPDVSESLLIDSGAQTAVASRLSGTVVRERAIGEIVRTQSAVIAGDVVFPTGAGFWDTTSGTGAKRPRPVLFGGNANGLCVIAVKGYAQVNMDGATTLNDPIGSSATAKQGHDDNTLTNPQVILGYVIQALGGAGLDYAEIL